MKKLTFLLTALLIILSVNSQSISKKKITSKVDEVTVYLDGAHIVRKKNIPLNVGTSILTFEKLSPFIDAKTIKVKATGALTVISVNHQHNYSDSIKIGKNNKQFLKELEDLKSKIRTEEAYLTAISEELEFLKKNRKISGNEKELNLDNYKATAEFYRHRIEQLLFEQNKHENNSRIYKKEYNRIKKARADLSNQVTYPTGEVVIKVDSKNNSSATIEISYKVKNAGWYPSYDIRVKSISDPLQIIYKANVHQNTRVDWNDVKIRFSSNNPVESLIARKLRPYFLNYYLSPPKYSTITPNKVSGYVKDLNTNQPLPGATLLVQGTTIGTTANLDGRYSLTIPENAEKLSCSYVGYLTETTTIHEGQINISMIPNISSLDEVVVVGYGTQRKSQVTGSTSSVNEDKLSGRTAGIRVRGTSSYQNNNKPTSIPLAVSSKINTTAFEMEVSSPYSVKSDNKTYAVNMKDIFLQANYEFVCSPKITPSAYLKAYIEDFEKHNLLEGEANIFFEDTYIGKSILDAENFLDTLELSLGYDRNVIVKRELKKEYSTKKIIGNKKVEEKTWAITVKNNKNTPVKIKLEDQVPVSKTNEIDVKYTLNDQVSTFNKETGIILWELKLPAGEQETLNFNYKVIYPKDRSIVIE
jgi:hypothetical protein